VSDERDQEQDQEQQNGELIQLPGTSASARTMLQQHADNGELFESVVILFFDKQGKIGVSYSEMDLSRLCLMKANLEAEITDIIMEQRYGEPEDDSGGTPPSGA
jgi:hypothetical protein